MHLIINTTFFLISFINHMDDVETPKVKDDF